MNRHIPGRSGWSGLGGITNYKWQKQFGEQWGILHNRYGMRDLLREWPETTAKVMAGADFISCVAFGRSAEFAQKYFRQGLKVVITGRIQTGSYTNRDGNKVYTTDVAVEEQEFAESKVAAGQGENSRSEQKPEPQVDANRSMNIPDGIDEELPFA